MTEEPRIQFQPLNDRVLILMRNKPVTTTGVVLPPNVKRPDVMGFIVATGPGRLNKRGQRVPMATQKGMVVKIPEHGGDEVKIDGVPHVIFRDAQIEAHMEAEE